MAKFIKQSIESGESGVSMPWMVPAASFQSLDAIVRSRLADNLHFQSKDDALTLEQCLLDTPKRGSPKDESLSEHTIDRIEILTQRIKRSALNRKEDISTRIDDLGDCAISLASQLIEARAAIERIKLRYEIDKSRVENTVGCLQTSRTKLEGERAKVQDLVTRLTGMHFNCSTALAKCQLRKAEYEYATQEMQENRESYKRLTLDLSKLKENREKELMMATKMWSLKLMNEDAAAAPSLSVLRDGIQRANEEMYLTIQRLQKIMNASIESGSWGKKRGRDSKRFVSSDDSGCAGLETSSTDPPFSFSSEDDEVFYLTRGYKQNMERKTPFSSMGSEAKYVRMGSSTSNGSQLLDKFTLSEDGLYKAFDCRGMSSPKHATSISPENDDCSCKVMVKDDWLEDQEMMEDVRKIMDGKLLQKEVKNFDKEYRAAWENMEKYMNGNGYCVFSGPKLTEPLYPKGQTTISAEGYYADNDEFPSLKRMGKTYRELSGVNNVDLGQLKDKCKMLEDDHCDYCQEYLDEQWQAALSKPPLMKFRTLTGFAEEAEARLRGLKASNNLCQLNEDNRYWHEGGNQHCEC